MSVELVDRRKAKSDVWKHFGFPADAHGAIHFPIAHTLQLSIKNGLAISRVQRVLGQCKKLVEHFKKSTKEKYKLREKQEMLKLPQHKLIQDCDSLGEHTRHAGESNGAAGSHCSSFEGREGEALDA
jgi:hypothetical protein